MIEYDYQKNSEKLLISWKEEKCTTAKMGYEEYFKKFFPELLDDSKIKSILTELLTNASRGEIEYQRRELLNKHPDNYDEEFDKIFIIIKGKVFHKDCYNCVNVSLEVQKKENKYNFKVKNYNVPHPDSIKRIKEKMSIKTSAEIIEHWKNLSKYSSVTGTGGVGLHIARNYIEKNGGTLKFSVDYDAKITCFEFDYKINEIKKKL